MSCYASAGDEDMQANVFAYSKKEVGATLSGPECSGPESREQR
jgi:hypothetical protein